MSNEVVNGLYDDDSAGDRIPLRHNLLKRDFQGFPGAAVQLGKQTSIIKKIPM
jgi:hypothetical protein